MPPIAFGRAEPGDLSFVIASWASSFRDANGAGVIPFPLYAAIYREQVLPWILARPGVQVWVARNPTEAPPLDLYGYVVIERDVVLPARVRVPGPSGRRVWATALKRSSVPLVHWCFTKEAKRRLGIARRLFDSAGVSLDRPLFFSCKPAGWPELAHLAPHATWRPDLARREKKPLEAL